MRLLLRLLASVPSATDHVADAELLRRFVASNDSAAFELVVRRHADAVWATCRRTLTCDADAEDAFQATFLVLIRKAQSIRTPCAGGWLHRVAVNASLKLRERARRITPIEPHQLDALPDADDAPADAELAVAVHEELSRLSERERLPVVLCDLEGLSHADAAKVLGWPVGTVSGRLSRARAKLRDRLARRGLAPPAVVVLPLAAPLSVIVNAQSLTAGAVSPAVVSLAEGALAMLKTSSWTWAAVACAGLVAVGGVAVVAQPDAKPVAPLPGAPTTPTPPAAKAAPTDGEWLPTQKFKGADGVTRIIPDGKVPTAFPDLVIPEPDQNDPKQNEKREAAFAKLCPRLTTATLKVEPGDDTLRKLLKARLHRGVMEVIRYNTRIQLGAFEPGSFGQLLECLNDMQAVATELWGGQPKELIPWLEELVVIAKEVERFTQLRVNLGGAPPQLLDAARRHRLRAEAALVKAKRMA